MSPTFHIQDPTALNPYSERYELIPLHGPSDLRKGRRCGKAPLHSGWRLSQALSVVDAANHMATGRNVGVRLRPTDLVVDVDHRNFAPEDDPLARMANKLGIDFDNYPQVITGSGGRHIYMTKSPEVILVDTLADFKGLEFKSAGRQVVAAGSVHPDGGGYRWDDDPLLPRLSDVAEAPPALLALAERPEWVRGGEAGGRTPEELEAWLAALDVENFREEQTWRELMMACHHATAGEGRMEWIAWSIGDPEFAQSEAEIGRRWDSLHADTNGKRITERTLFHALVKAGRKDLLPNDAGPIHLGLDGDAEWVWVTDAEIYVRRSDCKRYGAQQWRSHYGHLLPDQDIITAINRGKFPMRKFESLVYLPGSAEFPDSPNGARYNIWRSSGVEARPGNVQPFLDHLTYLFPDEVEREHVLDYLALLVRQPGEKIHFALLIQGNQGTGKSWISALLTRMIGRENVVFPSNDEVTSRWTGWMEGCQLGLIEELMSIGRMDVANRLKTVITEPWLRIENKNAKLYSIPNHLNLVCFTNHPDAVPIERSDRRWLVVFSPAAPLDRTYYERLFSYLDNGGAEAAKHWLMQRDVKLNPKGAAPSTIGKVEMRRSSLSEVEDFLLDKFEEGAAPFDFDLVRFEDIEASIPIDLKRRVKSSRNAIRRFLRSEVKAEQHTRYTKGDRPAWMLWSIRDHRRWDRMGAAGRIDAFIAHSQ